MPKIFLPSITTTENPDWELRIKEVKNLKLSQIALFLSSLDYSQRQNCYQKLEQINNLTIPFVHARTDMTKGEFDYLTKRFFTKKFNIHPLWDFPLVSDLGEYKDKIYIENTSNLFEADLLDFAGICLDISHLEDCRLFYPDRYKQIYSLIKKHPVGANHLNAISKEALEDEKGFFGHNCHNMKTFKEFDYLKKYPENYFGEYMAIELINPIAEQLKLIEYLKKLLKF